MRSDTELTTNLTSPDESLVNIAQQFVGNTTVKEITPLGNGNINDTYLVTIDRSTNPLFVLQRINTDVFLQPCLVMDNLCQFVDHAHRRLHQTPLNRRWDVPSVLRTRDDQHHWIDHQGNFWRALNFVQGTTTFDTIQDVHHGTEIGYGLGCFHNLLSDLPTEQLADTLPGFHVTPNYLCQYDSVLSQTDALSEEEQYCCHLIATHRDQLSILEDANAAGHLPLRTIHGDPKINNILIDTATGKAASLIDLDTIKPGLVHYDIGDCLRSSCNPLGEETQQWQSVTFDVDLCASVLRGYLTSASAFLYPVEYHYIYDAIWLITFELGLRFFSDHLAGDVYFKIQRPNQNLKRALVQFQLAKSVQTQEKLIKTVINRLKADYCTEAGCTD